MPRKIIVIEDDNSNVKTLYKLLKLYLHDVDIKVFKMGESAVENFQKGLYDLAIVDLLLKKSQMQGQEVIRHFREIDDIIPIIIVTGTEYGAAPLDSAYKSLNISKWVKKPVKASELETIIRGFVK